MKQNEGGYTIGSHVLQNVNMNLKQSTNQNVNELTLLNVKRVLQL